MYSLTRGICARSDWHKKPIVSVPAPRPGSEPSIILLNEVAGRFFLGFLCEDLRILVQSSFTLCRNRPWHCVYADVGEV